MGYFINGMFKKDKNFACCVGKVLLLNSLVLFAFLFLVACDQPVGGGGSTAAGATDTAGGSTAAPAAPGTTTPGASTPANPAAPATPTTPTTPTPSTPDPLPGPNDIELLGALLAAPPGSYGFFQEQEVAVTNTALSYPNFAAAILSFDNAANLAILQVMQWDGNAPALGKYLRITWQDVGASGSGHWIAVFSSAYPSAQEAQAAPSTDIAQSTPVSRTNSALAAPAGLSVASVDGQVFTLTWNSVPGAVKYRLLVKPADETRNIFDYSYDAEGTTGTLWVPDPGAKLLAIRAVDSTGHVGLRSSTVAAAALLSPPYEVSLLDLAYSKLTFSWILYRQSGTEYTYDIYRSPTENGTFSKIATTSSKIFTDQDLDMGTEYWYYLVAHSPGGFASGPSAKYRFATLADGAGGILVGLE